VKHGLWLIVARSATVLDAEEGGLDRDERDAVLAASRYAQAHWQPVNALKQVIDEKMGSDNLTD
jgi:hypothetical protein